MFKQGVPVSEFPKKKNWGKEHGKMWLLGGLSFWEKGKGEKNGEVLLWETALGESDMTVLWGSELTGWILGRTLKNAAKRDVKKIERKGAKIPAENALWE